jgi:hypothetical protein
MCGVLLLALWIASNSCKRMAYSSDASYLSKETQGQNGSSNIIYPLHQGDWLISSGVP